MQKINSKVNWRAVTIFMEILKEIIKVQYKMIKIEA